MFGKILLISALALIAWAVVARASHGAGRGAVHREARRTLWAIAASHYAGDPRDAIYRMDHRPLAGSLLVPGQRLLLPSAG